MIALLLAIGFFPMVTGLWHAIRWVFLGHDEEELPAWRCYALGQASWCAAAWVDGETGLAAIAAFFAVSSAVLWWSSWRNRRDRKRSPDALGAKSKALRDALVKRARDAARGARPVLRPVPQGSA